ncbi:hypothetical protein RFI_19367, partial [Reticulomyxa filosa]
SAVNYTSDYKFLFRMLSPTQLLLCCVDELFVCKLVTDPSSLRNCFSCEVALSSPSLLSSSILNKLLSRHSPFFSSHLCSPTCHYKCMEFTVLDQSLLVCAIDSENACLDIFYLSGFSDQPIVNDEEIVPILKLESCLQVKLPLLQSSTHSSSSQSNIHSKMHIDHCHICFPNKEENRDLSATTLFVFYSVTNSLQSPSEFSYHQCATTELLITYDNKIDVPDDKLIPLMPLPFPCIDLCVSADWLWAITLSNSVPIQKKKLFYLDICQPRSRFVSLFYLFLYLYMTRKPIEERKWNSILQRNEFVERSSLQIRNDLSFDLFYQEKLAGLIAHWKDLREQEARTRSQKIGQLNHTTDVRNERQIHDKMKEVIHLYTFRYFAEKLLDDTSLELPLNTIFLTLESLTTRKNINIPLHLLDKPLTQPPFAKHAESGDDVMELDEKVDEKAEIDTEKETPSDFYPIDRSNVETYAVYILKEVMENDVRFMSEDEDNIFSQIIDRGYLKKVWSLHQGFFNECLQSNASRQEWIGIASRKKKSPFF